MKHSLLQGFARPLPDELCEVLAGNGQVRIERIVSRGHASPPGFWYQQQEHEFVLLLSGQARLGFADGSSVTLVAGDWLQLSAQCRHRVEWTAPGADTVWLAVFYPPADD